MMDSSAIPGIQKGVDVANQFYVALPKGNVRNVSLKVITAHIDTPAINEELYASWIDQLHAANPLAGTGDVFTSHIASPNPYTNLLRLRAEEVGLLCEDNDKCSEPALNACEGSFFHVDTSYELFADKAFFVHWMEDDEEWDLLFPLSGVRVPLRRGTHVIFDTGNVHGVVKKGKDSFSEKEFESSCFQMYWAGFFSYELPALRDLMGVAYHEKEFFKGKIDLSLRGQSDQILNPLTGVITLPTKKEEK
jgi:hypothetical protein